MLPIKDVVVIIPVGPGSSPAFIIDTIESFQDYARCSYHFIIMDDSHQAIGDKVKQLISSIDVLYTPKPMGGWAGLYISLATAYQYALKHYQFKAILKLDTDALVINMQPEKEALELFESDNTIGLAGQYPNEYNGKPWDIAWPRQRITNATQTWKFFARPIAHTLLKKYYKLALQHKYTTGESVFGGAYFISYSLVKALNDEGLLPNKKMDTLNLGEDHLFALLAKSKGFQLTSLSGAGQPFACAWKGLPASPEKLFKEGRKIIHSVRCFDEMNEARIRAYFKMKRVEEKMRKPFTGKTESKPREAGIHG